MRIGTGRKPLRSSSHSEASSLPSSGSVKTPRLSVDCASAAPTDSEKSRTQALAAPTAAAHASAAAEAAATAALETAALPRLRCARLAGLASLGLPVERVDRLAAGPAATGGLLLRAVGAHVGPVSLALAAAVVLLPITAFVATIDVAVSSGIDVVAAGAFGESGVSDLGGLQIPPARAADRRALAAPAVVAVVDVDVGAVVADVHAA